MGFAKPINTVNGFINILAALQSAGYQGNGHISTLGIFNPHASVLIYIHFNENPSVAPITGTDGVPIGAGSTAIGSSFLWEKSADRGASVDLTTMWISCDSVIPLKIFGV